MRVLIINSVCGQGSTGRICCELAERLVEEGNECTVAFGRYGTVPERAKGYAHRIGTDFDVRLHGLETRLLDRHGFGSVRATERFVEWVKEYDPDIIHLHNIHGYYLNIKILFEYLKTAGKPIVWTMHDCWAFTGHCAHYDYVGCKKWQTCCGECPQKHRYPATIGPDVTEHNFLRKKELFSEVPRLTIVTPSQWLADQVEQSFLNGYAVSVINNGVDTKKFAPTESRVADEHGIGGKKIALGVANVWDERKGVECFEQLSRILNEEWKVALIGLDRTQLTALPKTICGMERTADEKELAQWYSAATVFVNPTLEDTYPTTNLEAQCCGCPTVTFNTGGSPESVYRKLKAAAVCNDKNAESLAECVMAVADMQPDRNELSAWARREFSSKRFTDEYLELYKKVVT